MATYFTPETFAFLRDLQDNNAKDWFDANRDRYETHWKAAALAFIDAVRPGMDALDPSLKAEARLNGSLRRVNRDVRFSKDKSPYNPRLHLIFWAGSHPNKSAGFHLVLNSAGVGYGAGTWAVDPAMLKRYRSRIMEKGDMATFEAALDEAGKVGCRLGEPELARVPSGFDAEGRQAELLRYKVFVARTHGAEPGPEFLTEDGSVERVLDLARALAPFNRWVNDI